MHALASAVAAAAPRKALLLHGSGGSAGAFVSRGAAPFIYACKGRYRDGGPDAWEFEALDADIVGGARSAGCGAWWTYPAGQRSFTADSYEGDLESICAVEAALEAGFRRREKEALQSIGAGPAVVLALGGGTIFVPGALSLVRSSSVVVVLDVPWGVLAPRLRGQPAASRCAALQPRHYGEPRGGAVMVSACPPLHWLRAPRL